MSISTLTKAIVAVIITLGATASMASASGGLTPPRTENTSGATAFRTAPAFGGGPAAARHEALAPQSTSLPTGSVDGTVLNGTVLDGRSPDTVDAGLALRPTETVLDGRSPDTVDAG